MLNCRFVASRRVTRCSNDSTPSTSADPAKGAEIDLREISILSPAFRLSRL